jgi:Carboxypeptidase regulatory-like domain
MRWMVVFVLMWVGIAAADDVRVATTVEGRVVDVMGKAVAHARIYVIPRDGKQIAATTDKDGRYRVELPVGGRYGLALAVDQAYSLRTVDVKEGVANQVDMDLEIDTAGGEVIQIEDRLQPAVKPKVTQDMRALPPYSDEAVVRDAWARAWLLLDVDERGNVARLKLLKAPGFDLDKICIEEAFGLKFEPARDGNGQPIKTYMLWTMEWPAWGWLTQAGRGLVGRRPVAHQRLGARSDNVQHMSPERHYATLSEQPIDHVPCAGAAPLNLERYNLAYRDCSRPDLRRAESLPWITRETAVVAVAELKSERVKQLLDKDYKPSSPWPGYISAGVTGSLALVTVYGVVQWSQSQDRVQALNWKSVTPEEHDATVAARDRWSRRVLVLTTTSLVSAGVTLLLWHRNPRKSSFSVQPSETGTGGAATFTTPW